MNFEEHVNPLSFAEFIKKGNDKCKRQWKRWNDDNNKLFDPDNMVNYWFEQARIGNISTQTAKKKIDESFGSICNNLTNQYHDAQQNKVNALSKLMFVTAGIKTNYTLISDRNSIGSEVIKHLTYLLEGLEYSQIADLWYGNESLINLIEFIDKELCLRRLYNHIYECKNTSIKSHMHRIAILEEQMFLAQTIFDRLDKISYLILRLEIFETLFGREYSQLYMLVKSHITESYHDTRQLEFAVKNIEKIYKMIESDSVAVDTDSKQDFEMTASTTKTKPKQSSKESHRDKKKVEKEDVKQKKVKRYRKKEL
jgi:hypothetical protein